MARGVLEQWKADHPHANADPAAFEAIREGLVDVKLAAILVACSVSKATA